MKKGILFILGLCCISPLLTAQKHGFHSIFENQAQWDLKVVNYGTGRVLPVSHFVRKDTTVFGQELMILCEEGDASTRKEVLIKEDEAKGKVYVVENGQSQLLYDFSLEKGDKFSFDGLDFTVVDVNEARVLDSKRKIIELSCNSKVADNLIWIEGIGSTISPLYYQDYASQDRYVKLACFFKGHNLEYSLSDQPCARQLLSTDMKVSGLNVALSPNPFSENIRIKINNPSGGDVAIRLFDPSGRLLYQELQSNPGQDFEKSVFLADLEGGVYYLNISSENAKFTQKVVKF